MTEITEFGNALSNLASRTLSKCSSTPMHASTQQSERSNDKDQRGTSIPALTFTPISKLAAATMFSSRPSSLTGAVATLASKLGTGYTSAINAAVGLRQSAMSASATASSSKLISASPCAAVSKSTPNTLDLGATNRATGSGTSAMGSKSVQPASLKSSTNTSFAAEKLQHQQKQAQDKDREPKLKEEPGPEQEQEQMRGQGQRQGQEKMEKQAENGRKLVQLPKAVQGYRRTQPLQSSELLKLLEKLGGISNSEIRELTREKPQEEVKATHSTPTATVTAPTSPAQAAVKDEAIRREKEKEQEITLSEYLVPEDPEFCLGNVYDSLEMAVGAMALYEHRNNVKFRPLVMRHNRKQYEYRCVYSKAVIEHGSVLLKGCVAKIRIYYHVRENGYTVKELGRVHTHPASSPPPERTRGGIPPAIVTLVKEMHKSGAPVEVILEYAKRLYFREHGKRLSLSYDKLEKYICETLKPNDTDPEPESLFNPNFNPNSNSSADFSAAGLMFNF